MSVSLNIAIAETSIIIRNGLETVLKQLSGFRIHIIEIATIDLLQETLLSHRPDLLIINPSLLGCFTIQQIKEDCDCPDLKCIALVYNVIDPNLLRSYDNQIYIYDNPEDVKLKLEQIHTLLAGESGEEEQQTLSAREKEIVVCVVKGMTNRQIADQLYLSTHTVVTHRRNIARKLQVHSASGLTVYAIVNKLVKLSDIQL